MGTGFSRCMRWLAPTLSIVVAALAAGIGSGVGLTRAASPNARSSLPRELKGTWRVLAGDQTLPGRFQSPNDVAVDAQGNIYVADTQNFRIVKLSPSGRVLMRFGDAGQQDGQFRFPGGISLDRAGNIYVADVANARVQKFSPRGYPVAEFGPVNNGAGPGSAPGEFASPEDVAVDSAGNLYVTDWKDRRVQKLSPLGKPLRIWNIVAHGKGSLPMTRPAGVAVTGSGTVYVSDLESGRIVKISPGGTLNASWVHGDEIFSDPSHLTTDAAGNLYVADRGHHRIVELSAAGKPIHTWNLGKDVDPAGVAVTPAGTIVVADAQGCRILQYRPDSATPITSWGVSNRAAGQFLVPQALAVGPASVLEVADTANGRIEQLPSVPGSTGPVNLWNLASLTGKRLDTPASIAVDVAGDVYVVDRDKKRVEKLLPSGAPAPGWPASARALPTQPIGVAVDSAGTVYIADAATSQIWRMDAAGHTLGRLGKGRGTGKGQFKFRPDGPAGVAADTQGHIYVADAGNNRIQKLTSGGKWLATWGRSKHSTVTFDRPHGVAVDTHGNVYVADTNADRIQELSPSGKSVAHWGAEGVAPGQFRYPYGIAVDAFGRVYVADSDNNRIQVFTPLQASTPVPARVSGPTPFAGCKAPAPLGKQPNREGETRLAVNPTTAGTGHVNLVGVWIQDSARDDVAGYSNDGGVTWQETPLPFSKCVSGGLPFSSSGDPWISIGPDGAAYAVGIGDTYVKHGKGYRVVADGVEVATSQDGGRSWANARALGGHSSSGGLKTMADKPTVIADPVHPGIAYIFWDTVSASGRYTGWMAKTTDGGRTWATPLAFLASKGSDYRLIALHQPLIDPRSGALYDIFWYLRGYPKYAWTCHKVRGRRTCGSAKTVDAIEYIAFVRSIDGGKTWSSPHIITQREQFELPFLWFGAYIRTGVGFDAALDPGNGALDVVWSDATYASGPFDQVLFTTSRDGGENWTSPVQVSQMPSFDPSVDVSSAGTVAVSYYAVRQRLSTNLFPLPKEPGHAIAAVMLQTSTDGGATFGEPRPLTGAFDLAEGLLTDSGYFMGDYEGLAADGSTFHPFFVAGNPGNTSDPVDVYSEAVQP